VGPNNALGDGRKFGAFTLVDDFTRECPEIAADTSLPGERIARVPAAVMGCYSDAHSLVTTVPSFVAKHWINGRVAHRA
jgi:hypothetical protein